MRISALTLAICCVGWAQAVLSVDGELRPEPLASISIIIDDMGNNLALGKRALELKGNISYSFLPNTPFAEKLAEMAHAQGSPVLLHLPMHGQRMDIIEPDALAADMQEEKFSRLLQKHLAAIPHISGVNNHMGSTVTVDSQAMDWIMLELSTRNLFFVDSRTTHLSIAAHSAKKFNVPFAERSVFLDNVQDEQAIRQSFADFIRIAKTRKSTIAIAHPHKITLSVLQSLIDSIDNEQLKLVSVSDLTGPQAVTKTARKNTD